MSGFWQELAKVEKSSGVENRSLSVDLRVDTRKPCSGLRKTGTGGEIVECEAIPIALEVLTALSAGLLPLSRGLAAGRHRQTELISPKATGRPRSPRIAVPGSPRPHGTPGMEGTATSSLRMEGVCIRRSEANSAEIHATCSFILCLLFHFVTL